MDGFRFFGYALGHHYVYGEHTPGRKNIWERFEAARDKMPQEGANRGIGTPEQLRGHLRGFQEAGVDQVCFIQQGGRNKHEHICESLELFGKEVMPEFHEHEEERERRKRDELAPFLEQALARKQYLKPLADDEIPKVVALGREIVEQLPKRQGALSVPLHDPAEG